MKKILSLVLLFVCLPSFAQRFTEELASVAALKTRLPGSINKSVFVRDFAVAGDGGGGLFVVTNTAIGVDGIFRIQSTADPNFSYDRRFNGPIDFRWGGAVGDGTPGDNAKIAAVLSAAASKGYAAFVSNLTGSNTTNQFMLSLIPSSLKANQKYLQIGAVGGFRIYTGPSSNFIYAVNGLDYTLPTVLGSAGSVFSQDGAGHVTWQQPVTLIGFDTNIFLLTGTNITINSGITLTNVTFVGGSSSNLLFGSGTSNTLPMWIGTHTLSNSPISLGTNYLRFAQPGGVVDTLRIADNATFPNDILKFLDGTGHWSVPITGSVGVTNAYNTVEDEGSPLSQQTTINFVGDGVTATDSGSNTVVTILATTNAVNFYASNFFSTNITVVNLTVVSNFFSTNVFTIEGDTITFLTTNTFLTNFFFNGTFITNIPAINPTDQYIPYRFDGATFLDSSLKRLVGGVINAEAPFTSTIRDVSGVNIDAGLGNEFSKELASNTTLGIINMSEGQQVSFTVTNTTFTLGFTNTLGAGVNELTWISGIVPVVDTNNVNVFHFWKSGGRIFGSDPEQRANVNVAGISTIAGIGVVVKTNATDFTTFDPLPIVHGGTGTNSFSTLADGNIIFHKLSGDSLDADDAQFLYSKSSHTLYLNRTVPTGQYQMLIAEGSGSVPQLTLYANKLVELDDDLTVDVSPGFNFAGTIGGTNNFKFAQSSLTLYNNDGSTNFFVKNPSGYTGVGLKVLKDNGRYDNVTTGGTNVIVEQIGPFTPGFIPYATGTNTLGDSPFQRVSATQIGINSATNVLSASGASLTYSNANFGGLTSFHVTNTNGDAALSVTPAGNASVQVNTGKIIALSITGSSDLWWTGGAFLPVGTADLGTGNNPWRDVYLSHLIWNGTTNTVRDFAGNGSPEGVEIASPGSIFRSYSGTIYNKATGTGNTGWTPFSTGGGSITINPTDNFLPVRTSATVFGDSLFSQSGDVVSLKANNAQLNVTGTNSFDVELSAGVGKASVYAYGDVNSGTLIVNAPNGTDYANLSSQNGNSIVELKAGGTVRTQLYPGQTTTGSAVAYNFDTANTLTNGDFIGVLKNNGSTRFSVSAVSGYTGAGTLFLADNGTYKAASGGSGGNTTNLFANVIDLAENNLGTIAGAGTATISINTNLYRGIFSGSTFSVNLPTPPDATNGYWCKITGTNTSGGTQIGTIKVATVTTALWREETKEATTTITNDTAAAFTLAFRVSNGAWSRVEATGDALTFPRVGGVIFIDTTTTSTIDASEKDLITYSVQTNSLALDKDTVRFRCSGGFGANGNSKQVRAYFGATTIFDSTSQVFNGKFWVLTAEITRDSQTNQIANVMWTSNDPLLPGSAVVSLPSEDLSSPVVFKVTGQGTAPIDIYRRTEVVEWLPSP